MHNAPDDDRGGTDPIGGAADVGARCPRCQGDLSRVPDAALYCPRCGASLAAPLPLPRIVGDGSHDNPAWHGITTAWQRLRQVCPSPWSVHAAAADLDADPELRHEGRTAILLGYASALYHLGWRYESGLGASRNRAEAIRCYFKAARLGNASARARLDAEAEPPFATAVHPAPPPEPAPPAPPAPDPAPQAP